jgi:serine/threonine protein kinase HipA of HipAB toxin-antitoxin module
MTILDLREYLERATATAFGSDDLTVLTLLGNNQIGRLQYRLEGQVFDDATEVAPELSEILSSDDDGLFDQLLKRFDMDSDGGALGFEDFCVLQAKTTKQKYDASLESCANTIKQYVSPQLLSQALADFFKLTVINVLVRNGDGHLKNSGIIYNDLKGYGYIEG